MVKNDYEKVNFDEEGKNNVNLVLNVNIFFWIIIWWMNKIFVMGNKWLLEEDDLFLFLEEDKFEVLIENL